MLERLALGLAAITSMATPAQAQSDKPNILVIWGDDIGIHNISAYTHGLMGYRTPNIDRIAREGAIFTDVYAEGSCTAGRSAFILGQHPFRTGLLTIGMPGSPHGIPDWAPTIADLLKDKGYATGQFGKNHMGDLDGHLPTNHGFDEFFGNLYHLQAEEEPEGYYYPKDPAFKKKYGPRGVLHTYSDGRIEDTGPLTKKRMETIDDEIQASAKRFIDAAVTQGKPFFAWVNTTRMHNWTRLKAASDGRTGIGLYPDGMVEHDELVGRLLQHVDDLKITDNTIVVYSTDNGPEVMSWPDGGTTPFRGEKGTTWEGGHRVPLMVRWPGVFEPGREINDMIAHNDWLPTLLAAVGEPRMKEKLLTGYSANGRKFRVHLDGYNFLPFFKGETPKGPREEYFFFDQGANLNAVRWNDWKVHFAVLTGNIVDGTRSVPAWPTVVHLRGDPYERGPSESTLYMRWYGDLMWLFIPIQDKLDAFLADFESYPYQGGTTISPGGINYQALAVRDALRRLKQMEGLVRPR